jgi:hypothetical protein
LKEKHVEKIIKKYGYKVYPLLEMFEVLLFRNQEKAMANHSCTAKLA